MNAKEIDRIISKVRKELNYQRYLTPLNYKYENEKFLDYYHSGKEYNPIYSYYKFALSKESLKVLMNIKDKTIDPKETPKERIVGQSLKALHDEIHMYESIGESDFYEYSKKVYGEPSYNYSKYAEQILKNCFWDTENDAGFDAKQLMAILKHRIDEYGFDWRVILSDTMAAKVSVEPDEKVLYINAFQKFSLNDCVRLRVHEIDTHILRAENGFRRGYEIFSTGTPMSLIHEEGLAIYNENRNNVLDIYAMKLYAARFLCCVNISLSFFELFKTLIQYGCSEALALYIVSRIKRGLRDTSLPGGFIKDYVYFQGFYEIKNAIQKNRDCFYKLYYGSISLNDLTILDEEAEQLLTEHQIVLPHSINRC